MTKQGFFKIAALVMVMLLIGGSGAFGAKAKYTLRIASILADTDPETLGLKKFKELVESASQGKIAVQLYPNCQLGAAGNYLDSLRRGMIQMASPGSVMAQLQPLVAAPEMPFLFRDWAHARAVLTDPAYTDQLAEGLLEKHGIRTLGFAPRSFRVMTFNEPVKNFEDLQKKRLRVPNIPFYIKFAEAVGTSPVALPFSELFSGLEQKVVDGQENPYATIRSSKLYEVQKYVVETNHIFTTHGWYMNEKFFSKLPNDLQKVILDSADKAIKYTFDISIEAENEAKAFLKGKGINILVPDEAFKTSILSAKPAARKFFYEKYPGSQAWAERVDALE